MAGRTKYRRLKQLTPWVAGASLAATQVAMSSNCSITREGRCNTCGSCAFALVTLVSWAIWRKDDRVTTAGCSDRKS